MTDDAARAALPYFEPFTCPECELWVAGHAEDCPLAAPAPDRAGLREPTIDELRHALQMALPGYQWADVHLERIAADLRRANRAALAAPAPDRAALLRAAQNVSDRRTLMDDGFWVSQKEMRALDDALAAAPAPAGLREAHERLDALFGSHDYDGTFHIDCLVCAALAATEPGLHCAGCEGWTSRGSKCGGVLAADEPVPYDLDDHANREGVPRGDVG